MVICPHCNHEATQTWYCVERDGQIVPLRPVIDDGIWHCAVCYYEFVPEPEETTLKIEAYNTGGGKTARVLELVELRGTISASSSAWGTLLACLPKSLR